MKDYPRMPIAKNKRQIAKLSQHRKKISPDTPLFSAAVARPVGKAEIAKTPRAKSAMSDEWAKLRRVGKVGCWDESKVEEKSVVLARYRKLMKKCHWGRVFGICVEKGSELADNDANKKYNGRVVFQGNDVKDENYDNALFAELGSSPATMQAGKMTDAIGLLDGNEVQISDAEQAYTQAKLKGTDTWVSLPRDQWPQSWIDAGYKDPVCPLLYALYGHPDSGGYWEQHCNAHVESVGFKPLSNDGWSSCYWHARLKCLLVIYVDDFKMAGPRESLAEAWKLLARTKTQWIQRIANVSPKERRQLSIPWMRTLLPSTTNS